jgi:hypothetical protein
MLSDSHENGSGKQKIIHQNVRLYYHLKTTCLYRVCYNEAYEFEEKSGEKSSNVGT